MKMPHDKPWMRACLLAASLAVPGSIAVLGAQPPGAATGQRKPALTHQFPIPAGYVEALAVDSPATEFYEDLKVSWSLREANTNGLISVLARMNDVDNVYHVGPDAAGNHGLPNPMDVRHCYICFLESGNVGRQLSEMKAALQSRANENPSNLEKLIQKIKINEVKPLGIIKEIGNGFVFGYLVGPSRVSQGKAPRTARLFLTAAVGSTAGGYFINDVSIVKNAADLQESLTRVEGIAGQIHPVETAS